MPPLLSLMMQYFMLDMLIDTDPTGMFTCVRGLCLVAMAASYWTENSYKVTQPSAAAMYNTDMLTLFLMIMTSHHDIFLPN